jgi:hypothetical protein
MKEFCELLVEGVRPSLTTLRNQDVTTMKESFDEQRYEPEVFLLRIFNYHFNKNRDNNASIAEIESGLTEWLTTRDQTILHESSTHFWDAFALRCRQFEEAFRGEIEFELLDRKLGKIMNSIALARRDLKTFSISCVDGVFRKSNICL